MRDRDYVSSFQSWDFDAFWALYEKYIDNIFSFIYRKTSDHQIAEDLTSKVWMKALKGLEFFWEQDNANFKSWIYRIAQNTVIDYYRSHKQEGDIEDCLHLGFSPDFVESIDNNNKLSEVKAYLWQLKDIEQEIVTLRVWDNLSYKQIAKILEKKEDNCKKIFSRALKKIKSNIGMILLILLAI